MVLLSVRDHGPGVPSDERDQVFERLWRGRQKAEIPGTGIGLSVVKTLIEAMDGSVAVAIAMLRGRAHRHTPQEATAFSAVTSLALTGCALA